MQAEEGKSHIQTLLDLAANGDDEAYRELLDRTSRRLLTLTRRMLANYPQLKRWEQTDDVFQNAGMRLYQSLSEVRPPNKRAFFGLAATQIRRTLINLLRHYCGPQGMAHNHHSGVAAAGKSDRPDDVVVNIPAEDTSPSSLLEWAEFHSGVGDLPAEQREVFELVWYGGAKRKEAAAILQISERTVIRRLNGARIGLHAIIGSKPLEQGDTSSD